MRSFITHTTKNYEDITYQLVRSIKKYSNYNIIVYTIDYTATDKLLSVCECKRLDLNLPPLSDDSFTMFEGNQYVNRDTLRTYLTLGAKVDCMLDACESQINEWVYLDSDCIVNTNVDDLFEYCKNVKDFPLASLGPYEYVLIVKSDGTLVGNPFWKEDGSIDLCNTLEWGMMNFFGMSPEQRSHYRTTNVMVGTKNVKEFITIWKDCKNLFPKIVNLNQICPFHEETIYNVLTWKISVNDVGLPMVYINVNGSDTVKHFLTTNTESDVMVKEFYRLPKDKSNIKVFHGEKRESEIETIFELIDNKNNSKIKLLFLAPHLSTGGMPSFLLKRIQCLLKYSDLFEIFVVEYSNLSSDYVVQKNEILKLIPPSHFWTLDENKMEVIDIIKNNKIDIVHLDEMLESFDAFNKIPTELMNLLYDNNRTWKVVETCHNIFFNPYQSKKFNPEAYAFCTPYHKEKTFSDMPSYGEVIEFPIDNNITTEEDKLNSKIKLGFDLTKKHIINVGLWTQGKNQKEGVELARLLEKSNPELQFHFIGNQAPNFQEYWEPIMNDIPSNVIVWGERNDVDLFMKSADVLMFNSTWECNPLVLREGVSYGLKILSRNLPQYMDMFTQYITPIDDDLLSTKDKLLQLLNTKVSYILPVNQSETFAKKYENLYDKVNNMNITKQEKLSSDIEVIQYFVEKPFLEIKGDGDGIYNIKFRDEQGIVHYENNLPLNRWVKLNREYYTKWNTQITKDGNIVYDNTLDYTGKRVYIAYDSKSLGDSIAWIPYALEFKKKHNCIVIVSTFWNKLFKKTYPELIFVEPGVQVHNLYGMYKLGWFYDSDKEPELPNTIPLQKTVTNILGLEFTEIKPEINFTPKGNPYNTKYVTIANESTSGLKYWNNPTGWQELVDYLVSKGYKVINVSKKGDDLKNVTKLNDTSIDNTMNVIYHSDFFVGLSSGLSWLSWAIGKHVVMISNFTEPDHEFTTNCTRITNPSVCNGCWNKPQFKFDKGDWNWCPEHKGTPRQFECHKSITSEMVINQIQHLI